MPERESAGDGGRAEDGREGAEEEWMDKVEVEMGWALLLGPFYLSLSI